MFLFVTSIRIILFGVSTDVDSFFRRWFSILIVLDQMNTWINADHTQMIPLLESALYTIDREVIVLFCQLISVTMHFELYPMPPSRSIICESPFTIVLFKG